MCYTMTNDPEGIVVPAFGVFFVPTHKEDTMAALFPARFDGFCRKCLLDFNAGTDIAYNADDEIVCEDCINDEEAEQGIQDAEAQPSSGWRKRR